LEKKKRFNEREELLRLMVRKFQSEGDALRGVELLNSTSGIEIADALSIEHILLSLSNLE
jgi:hypothetical protein